MADVALRVDPRTVLGKRVKRLRREGLIPANLYGHALASQAVQAETAAVTKILRTAGRNAIITLEINGEKGSRPVMVRGLQRSPVSGELLHVDFYQVSLTEKMRADVPLALVGTAPAVTVYGGILLQNVDSVTVEALPADMPSQIEVEVSGLAELDAAVHLKDLAIDPKVQVLADEELVVAKVAAPRRAVEVEEEVAVGEAEEAAEAEEEAAPEEGEEAGRAEEGG